jgi:hypothetical protein
MPRSEDDFYRPPQSRDFYDSFLSALDISSDAGNGADNQAGTARLLEFQRRGYYLTYLSECPVTPKHSVSLGQQDDENAAHECISRLAPTLIKRIRFNYKPKHVALLGVNLSSLIEIFEHAGTGPLLLLNQGVPLTIPECGRYLERAVRGAGST